MYRIKILLFACGLLSLFASCNESETHELIPVEKRFILFADQTVDSLMFSTFDSWIVTPQVDWLTVDGDSHMDIKYDNSKRYLFKVFLNAQPNTTGKTRSGLVHVQARDDSFLAPIVQLGLLNVTYPYYKVDSYLDDSGIIPDVAHYELIDSAHWERDSLCFEVESVWGLTFVGEKPDWIELDKDAGFPGNYTVYLTLTPNTNPEKERETKLCLTSGEVSNEIVIRQLPAKKDKDEEGDGEGGKE